MEPPFSEAEKRWVLAEAIRTSSIPIEKLLAILSESNVSPQWKEMFLPYGRNLNSCIDVFNALRNSPVPPNLLPNLPGAAPPLASGSSSKRKSGLESLEAFPVGHTPKRRQSGADPIPPTRTIQPKPSSNGSPQPFSPLIAGQQAKKRGRPPKAVVEARNAEAVARGEVLPPPRTPGARNPQMIQFDSRGLVQRDPVPSPRMLAPNLPVGGEFTTGPSSATMTSQSLSYSPMVAPPSLVGTTTEDEAVDASAKKKRIRAGPKAVKVPKHGAEGGSSTVDPQFGPFQSLTGTPPEQVPEKQAVFPVRSEAEIPPVDMAKPSQVETKPLVSNRPFNL